MSRLLVVSLIGFGILAIGYAFALFLSKFITTKDPANVPGSADYIAARRAELEARRKALDNSRELADISQQMRVLDEEAAQLLKPEPTSETPTSETPKP